MSPEKAKQILTDTNLTEFSTGRLYSLGLYLSVSRDDKEATLDGEFTADQLEAIAAWMRDPDSVVVGVGVLVCST